MVFNLADPLGFAVIIDRRLRDFIREAGNMPLLKEGVQGNEATMSPPQLTAKAIVLGILLAAVLAGANAYLGLFAGMTVSASIPAAVISMGVLRLFHRSNILENNIVQTGASAGESLAAGVIFTLPALVIMNYWSAFEYQWVLVIAGLGGLLGVLFTIPLRRSLIVAEKLTFPEGIATAEVLRVGEDPRQGLGYLMGAALAGGLAKLAETGLGLWSSTAQAATYIGKATVYGGANLSPALLSVGYIVGINIATLVFAGGAIAWCLAIPFYSAFFLETNSELAALAADGASAVELAYGIWSAQVRYLGVGAMLTGGIWALFSMRRSLVTGIRSGLRQYRERGVKAPPATERDTPMKWVLRGILLLAAPLFFLYYSIHSEMTFGISLTMTLVMVIAGFLFASVAAYMAGLVGSSNNPVSGVTIATILFSSLALLGFIDAEATIGPMAAILIGAVVACAAAIAGDNMQDLKAGYLLGATPWKQQAMQGIGVLSSALVMAPILNLLLKAYGIGVPTPQYPDPLLAPQATLMASVAEGVFGAELPWEMVGLGALLGAAIIGVDTWLSARGSRWRAPVLAVAVGVYLPLDLSAPIIAGGLIAKAAERFRHRLDDPGRRERHRRYGILVAAGLITGEALMGILIAIPIVAAGDREVLALAQAPWGGLPGLVVMGLIAWGLYRTASGRWR